MGQKRLDVAQKAVKGLTPKKSLVSLPGEALLFENQPELLKPEKVAELTGYERGTVYEWRSRPNKYGTPPDLFIKFGRSLRIRTSILREWFMSKCI